MSPTAGPSTTRMLSPASPASRERDTGIAGRYRAGGSSPAAGSARAASWRSASSTTEPGSSCSATPQLRRSTRGRSRRCGRSRSSCRRPSASWATSHAALEPWAPSVPTARAPLTAPDGTILFIDLSTGAIHAPAGGHTASVQSVRYSPNGRMLVSTADDDNVVVWDARTAQPLQTLVGHAGRPTDSAFSADGRTLYTSSLDGTVIEWDLGSLRRSDARSRPVRTPTPAANAPLTPPLAISPDGSRFAALTAAGTVGIFSVHTPQPQTSLTIPRAATITALAWSPVGSELAVGDDNDRLQLWDVNGAPHLVRTLTMAPPTRHVPGAIQSVAFSADGRLIAASDTGNDFVTSTLNGRIAIWRTRTRKPITMAFQRGTGANAVAFSPVGRVLAVALEDGRVLILDSSNGTQLRAIHPLEGDNGGTISLALRPKRDAHNGHLRRRRPTLEPVDRRFHQPSRARCDGARHQYRVRPLRATLRDGRRLRRRAEAVVHLQPSTRRRGPGPRRGTSGNAQFTAERGKSCSPSTPTATNLASGPSTPPPWRTTHVPCAGRNLTREEWSRFITGYRYSQVCP